MVGVSGFQPGFKVWLEKGGAVFGEGLFNLLVGIEKTGSISGAACEMGMSYRSAWGKIRVCEKKWGIMLVSARVGGDTGGGSTVVGKVSGTKGLYRTISL